MAYKPFSTPEEPIIPRPQRPSTGGYRPFSTDPAPDTSTAPGTAPRPSHGPSRGLWHGARPGLDIQDIMNPLRAGEFAVGGILTRRPGESFLGAAQRGIERQQESMPEIERMLRDAGAPDHWVTKAAAFAGSLILDPINILPVGRVAGAVGRVGAAVARTPTGGRVVSAIGRAAAGVAPETAARIKAGRQLSNIMRHQRVRTALGYDQAVGVGKEMIDDSVQVVKGNKKDALRLRQTVGEYFDVGADTMVHDLNAAASVNPAALWDPAVIAAARQKGLQAQQAWLTQLPPDVAQFANKWIKRIADDDTRLGKLLVQKGMMSPQVLAKWEGMHLRRIYEKFENPEKFLDFLHSTNPREYSDYAAKLARGRFPTAGVPMPVRTLTARGAKTAAAGAKLGELTDAAARYIVGRKSAEELIARGTAFQSVATRFGETAQSLAQKGLDIRNYLPMPDTPGWGALAGKYVPKAMHDILTHSIKGEQEWSKFAKAIGWWKVGKVILNPASHFRNFRTNLSLVHNSMGLSGLNPADWVKAYREVRVGGPLFQEAKKFSSAFSDTLVGSEIRRMATVSPDDKTFWNKLWDATGGRMERLYEFEEQWGKMAVYLAAKRQFMKRPGANAAAASARAARMAELALFNYRDVPEAVRTLSRRGFYPFITFPYKVATQTVPLALKKPGRLAAQAKALSALSDPLTEEEKRSLPAYMRTGGWFKLPDNFRIHGKKVLWDLNYELAYGDLGELKNPIAALANILRGNFDEQASALLTPFGQLAAELIFNKSALTGRPVVRGESSREIRAGQVTHAVRALGPTWLGKLLPTTEFAPGGELGRSIEAAVPGGQTGKSFYGQKANPLQYSLSSAVLGLRTVPLDVQQNKLTRQIELERAINEKQSQLRAVSRLQVDASTKKRRQKDIMLELNQLIKRFRETGSVE